MIARSLALFANFFLIILAYYQVKAASRSLLIDFAGANWLPYVWVYSAIVLALLIGFYHRIVARYSRVRIVLGSLVLFAALLVIFHGVVGRSGTGGAVAFYIFVDIFSVILVEQFWSLTNSVTKADEGRNTYWFVGTGGLAGGVAGGVLAGFLVTHTVLDTIDLLYTCAALLVVTFVLNLCMWRGGMYSEVRTVPNAPVVAPDWRSLAGNRYLLLIAATVCCSQLVQPIVEYQFLSTVESAGMDRDRQTAFIANFFSVMGLVSIGVNVVLTPLIHRYLGIFCGLSLQPLLVSIASFGYFLQPTLAVAGLMKISDRGLSYSINRASKELLYIPVDPVETYQAKAWIDMLGYRLFKVLGSGLILLSTQWLPIRLDVAELSAVTFAVCLAWAAAIAGLARSYARFTAAA